MCPFQSSVFTAVSSDSPGGSDINLIVVTMVTEQKDSDSINGAVVYLVKEWKSIE